MKRNLSPFKLGLFVLCGGAIVIAALLWIGAAHFFESTKTYVTFFDQSIDGLNPGSNVSRLGVNIGRISSISLAQNGRLARVEMKIDPHVAIGKDEAAEKQSAGLTGGNYLAIVNAPPDLDKVTPKIDFPTRYPVIPSVPGTISRIENSLEGIAGKFKEMNFGNLISSWAQVGQNANKIVSNKDIDETLNNLKQASLTLKTMVGAIGKPENVKSMNAAIEDFSSAAASARKAGTAISGQVEAIPPKSLAQMTERVDRAARETEAAAASLNNQMTRILSRFEQTANQLTRVLSDLDGLVQSFREEPGRIFKEPRGKEPFKK